MKMELSYTSNKSVNINLNEESSDETDMGEIKKFFGFQDYTKPEFLTEEESIGMCILPQKVSEADDMNNLELRKYKRKKCLSMLESASTFYTENTENCLSKQLEQSSIINSEIKHTEDSFKLFEMSICNEIFKKPNNLNNDDYSQLSLVSNAASKNSTTINYDSSCHYNDKNEITHKELQFSSSHFEAQQKKEQPFLIEKPPKNSTFTSASASTSTSTSTSVFASDSLKAKKTKILTNLLRRFPSLNKPPPLNSCSNSKKMKRKYQNDSKNKKLKTKCLGLLSSFLPQKDLFSKPKNCTIKINKEFNRKLISSIINDALRKKYPKEDLFETKMDEIKKKIKNDIDIDILSMTFAEFFDCIYLPSGNFEALLSKNADDANYLISLIKNAFDYVDYFEKEKGNKPKKSKDAKDEEETETETGSN